MTTFALPGPQIKECKSCEATKVLEDFPPDRRYKDGRGTKCRVCALAVRRAFYAKYPGKEAERKLRNAESRDRWYWRNRDREILRMRWNATKRKYGLDEAGYYGLLTSQDDACAICGSSDPGRTNGYFFIDHDHATRAIRGLLCHRCNVGLGMLADDPERLRAAASYIEKAKRG